MSHLPGRRRSDVDDDRRGGGRPASRAAARQARLADREIRLGIWKIHILHHAASRTVWGLWLLDELAEHGHRLSPGTLYPILARMERNGWLRRTGDASHPRARQTLHITAEGRRLLRALQRDVAELHDEIVLGRAPETGRRTQPPPRPRSRGGRQQPR